MELYNPTDADINLKDYQISNKNKVKKAWQLPDKTVAAKGFVIIYCDKEGKEDNRLHADFRLESAKGCTAFGRKTDGADEWGYQLTPTPGKPNTGETCKAKQILGAPVFSVPGRVVNYGQKSVSVELSLPEGAPKEAYITYTTDGSEPTATSKKYTETFHITKSTAIRAKVFCEGWLSPLSTAQSYIFHARKMTVPIFSIQTDDRYLNDKEIGLFANNNSKEDKKLHDWRRPVNVEFFPRRGCTKCYQSAW